MLANPQEVTAVSVNGDRARSAEATFRARKRQAKLLSGFEGWRGFLPICDLGFCSAQSRVRPRNRPELQGPCQNQVLKAAKPPRSWGVAHERAAKRPALGRGRANKARNHAVNRPEQANPITVPSPPAAGGAPLLTVALNRGNIGPQRACQLLR